MVLGLAIFPGPVSAARGDGQSCVVVQQTEGINAVRDTGATALRWLGSASSGQLFDRIFLSNSATDLMQVTLCADRDVVWAFDEEVQQTSSTPSAGGSWRAVKWSAVSRDGSPFTFVDMWGEQVGPYTTSGQTSAGVASNPFPSSNALLLTANSSYTFGAKIYSINVSTGSGLRWGNGTLPYVYQVVGEINCAGTAVQATDNGQGTGCGLSVFQGQLPSMMRATATPVPPTAVPLNATVQVAVATQVASNLGPILTAIAGSGGSSSMPGGVQTAIVGQATWSASNLVRPTGTPFVSASAYSVNCTTYGFNNGWPYDIQDQSCAAVNVANSYLEAISGQGESSLGVGRGEATAIKSMWTALETQGSQQIGIMSTMAADLAYRLNVGNNVLGLMYTLDQSTNNQLKLALTPQVDASAKLGTVVSQNSAAATAMGGVLGGLSSNNNAVTTAIANVINTNTGLLGGVQANQVTLNDISYGINEGQATAAAAADTSAFYNQYMVDYLANIAVYTSKQATVAARATVPGWQSDAAVVNGIATLTAKYQAPAVQFTQVAGASDAGVVNAVSTLTAKYQAPAVQFTQVAGWQSDASVVNGVATLTAKYQAPAVQFTQVAGWQSDTAVVDAVATLTGKYQAPAVQFTQVAGWQSDTAVVDAVATSGARAYPTADGAVSSALVGIRSVSEASGTSVAGVADAITSMATPYSPSALWAPLSDQVRVRPTFAAEARGTVVAVVADRLAPVNAWASLATSLVDGLTDDCAAIPTITLPAIVGGGTVGMVPSWFSGVWCQFRTLAGYVVIVLSVFTAVPAFVRLFGSGGVR